MSKIINDFFVKKCIFVKTKIIMEVIKNETELKLEEAKKLLIEAETAEINECTQKYFKFLEDLQKEYNVKLNAEFRGVNNQCEIVNFFTKVK